MWTGKKKKKSILPYQALRYQFSAYIHSHFLQRLVQFAHLVLQSRRANPHRAPFITKCNAIEAYLEKAAFSRKIPLISHRQPYIPIYYIKFLKESTLCLLVSLHTKHSEGNRWSSLFFPQENSSSAPCHTSRRTSSTRIKNSLSSANYHPHVFNLPELWGLLPIPSDSRFKAWVCGSSLAGNAVSNPAGGMYVCCCECCEFSSTVLCDGPFTCPMDSTECGGSECDRKSSTMRQPWTNRAVEPWELRTSNPYTARSKSHAHFHCRSFQRIRPILTLCVIQSNILYLWLRHVLIQLQDWKITPDFTERPNMYAYLYLYIHPSFTFRASNRCLSLNSSAEIYVHFWSLLSILYCHLISSFWFQLNNVRL
jgi:hypothetical protein